MNDYGWLKELKVGDDVIIHNYMCDTFAKVERITPTTIIVYRCKYRVSNGRAIGKDRGFCRNYLIQATPEKFAKRKFDNKRQFLRQFEWNNLADDLVEPIYNMIKTKKDDDND